MNTLVLRLVRYVPLLAAALLVGTMPIVHAAATPASPTPQAAPNAPTTQSAPATAPPASAPGTESVHHHWHRNHDHIGIEVNSDSDSDDNSVVTVGGNSNLAAGDKADSVVSVLGSSTSAGEVTDSVVSVLGSSHVTGPVGDSVVAVLGDVYVDSKVEHDVVAVLGSITLGPNADIGGDLVAIGGARHIDPAAKVHGTVQSVGSGEHFAEIQPWITHCLLLGRPLAFISGIGWAWTLAFVALALYMFAGLLFAPAVEHCADVLEKYPGQSLLTMILTIIATPIVFVILFVTVVGIIAVPFLAIALFLAKFFGKLVMLAWIGRRVIRSSAQPRDIMRTVAAVLVGGLLVMLLYCVPFIGIIAYYLLGLIGLGVVIYALLLQIQGRRPAAAAAAGSAPPAAAAPAAAAFAQAGTAEGTVAGEGAAAAAVPPPPAGPRPGRPTGEAAIALPRAGFWVRMAALLLDVILVAVVLHFIRVWYLPAPHELLVIALAVYGVLMWRLRGSTVGGIIFNLAVVRQDGHDMDWGTAVVRGLSSFLSLFALGLGFIWIAIDPEKRGWHDKIAGTIVVRVP
jgi:uncharacterized RDD family membrane protein YckC